MVYPWDSVSSDFLAFFASLCDYCSPNHSTTVDCIASWIRVFEVITNLAFSPKTVRYTTKHGTKATPQTPDSTMTKAMCTPLRTATWLATAPILAVALRTLLELPVGDLL